MFYTQSFSSIPLAITIVVYETVEVYDAIIHAPKGKGTKQMEQKLLSWKRHYNANQIFTKYELQYCKKKKKSSYLAQNFK